MRPFGDMALIAYETRDRHSPDETFTRYLNANGIEGDMTNPRFRELWLELARAYGKVYRERSSKEGLVCHYCGSALPPREHGGPVRKWCNRKCWSMARTYGTIHEQDQAA